MSSVLVIEKVVGLDLIETERGGKNKIWNVMELMEQLFVVVGTFNYILKRNYSDFLVFEYVYDITVYRVLWCVRIMHLLEI